MNLKRILSVNALVLLSFVVIFSGCEKDNDSEDDILSFIASIETLTPIEKTGNKIFWESGDKVLVNGATYSATPNSIDATMALLEFKSGIKPMSPFKAIYPLSLMGDNNVTTLPVNQIYSDVKIINNPMYAESSESSLYFKNICGLIEITIKGTDKVKNIEVSADQALSGTFIINDQYEAVLTDATKKGVVLDCGDGVQLNESKNKQFYLTVPAGKYSNLTIKITTTDSKECKKTLDGSVKISRNTIFIYDFGTPEFKQTTFQTPE